jgi:hypothetical protein
MKKMVYALLILFLFCFENPALAQKTAFDPKSLEGKSLEELYLMRNEIYARHGKPFKVHELNTYFQSQDWYELDGDYNDSRISKPELDMAAMIRKKETELLKNNYLTDNGQKRMNFNNILNKSQFGSFTKEEIEKLTTHGFLVVPAQHEQFFYVYEDNFYKGIASFVTTDSVLQLYHMFFNFTLRNLEAEKLLPILKTLTGEMVKNSQKLYKGTKDQKVKEAARRNVAFFSVSNFFLTGSSSVTEPSLAKIIKNEIEKCEQHSRRENSLIFNPRKDPQIKHDVDYTQFIIRGHYTRSKELGTYFMGMIWFGLNSFVAGQDLDLIQSLIITEQLYSNKIGKRRLIDLWEDIYEPTAFYAGVSNDLGPKDFKSIIDAVFGKSPRPEDFVNPEKLKEAREMINERYQKTKIRVELVGIPGGPQFRLMGQRYIPDSEILQRLSNWPERPFPKGLDIVAVLGSESAKKILLEQYKEGETWTKYPDELEKLMGEFGELKPEDWKKNLYYHWIWCLKALIELGRDFQYPFFMENEAWELKNVNTSLASWAELRHDVILYDTESGAECGDGEWEPDPPKAYVEPNIIFYKRLGELLSFTREGLKKRELLTKQMEEKFKKFVELVSFLEKVSTKELRNQPLTTQEYNQIRIFGSLLEDLTITVLMDEESWIPFRWFEIKSDIDKNIAVIADVHTSQGGVLEEAVGPAFEVYVIVEIDGYLKLTRGAIFSYYEFEHPASDRLTDEKWQKMVKEGKQPPLPDWTKEYLSDEPGHEVPKQKYTYFSCD